MEYRQWEKNQVLGRPLFGSGSLAMQYWDLYSLANEHNITIDRVWDGVNIKNTFRRCFSEELLNIWLELLGIAKTIQFFLLMRIPSVESQFQEGCTLLNHFTNSLILEVSCLVIPLTFGVLKLLHEPYLLVVAS